MNTTVKWVKVGYFLAKRLCTSYLLDEVCERSNVRIMNHGEAMCTNFW